MALLLLIIEFVIVILIKNLIVLFSLFSLKLEVKLVIYLFSVYDKLTYMINEIYRLYDSNDVDYIRTINRYIRLHFSWIATMSGYDSFIFRYVERKLNYHYQLVNRIKQTHKHASNFL